MEADSLDRRTVLGAGVAIGGLAAFSKLTTSRVEAAPAEPLAKSPVELKKTVCPFCSVGCSIWAEVQNGVWIGQEPVFESPINMGTHCAKGASTRELGKGERRLKYPMKLANGKWTRVSWQQAIDEIGDKLLQIRKDSGRTSSSCAGRQRQVTSRPTCSASFGPSGAPTTAITKRASAILRPSPGLPARMATAR